MSEQAHSLLEFDDDRREWDGEWDGEIRPLSKDSQYFRTVNGSLIMCTVHFR